MYERAPIVHCALSENGLSHQHRYQEEYSTHFSFSVVLPPSPLLSPIIPLSGPQS